MTARASKRRHTEDGIFGLLPVDNGSSAFFS